MTHIPEEYENPDEESDETEFREEDFEEDPRSRFRRLTSEEGEEEEAAGGRHPTGDPDLTGGWYAQGDGEPDQPPESPPSPGRHPTGDPDLTGGWYAQEQETPQDEGVDELADTQPTSAEGLERFDADTIPPDQPLPEKSPSPPAPLGRTPPKPPPPLDEDGMPLPQRVEETDLEGTRVSSAAYSSTRRTRAVSPRTQPAGSQTPPSAGTKPSGFAGLGCLVRIAIAAVFGFVLLGLGLVSFVVIQYYSIASTLPPVDDLRDRASAFETTRILDRDGNLLYEILDPNAGRRTYVPLENISPFMIAATIATEDEDFYSHPGFSISAIFRAYFQNLSAGETVSGASTITQQLARTLLFAPEEAASQTYSRKIREAILAQEITRRYSKDEILELYLNEIYFGNLAYGVEAAAQTYFGVSASNLTMSQAAFLAGLPQAPSVYDVYSNRDVTLARQQDVLRLMIEASDAQNCIFVSTSPQPVCVNLDNASVAAFELVDYEFKSPDVQIQFPHWVNYIRFLLEEQYDPQTIYRSGFTVRTTLDPALQEIAQSIVQKQVATLVNNNAQSGALVALIPATGEIVAMVGSADYYDEDIDGQINMAVSPRQPGSSFKPLTYTHAFEKGWTPATLLWDVRSEFPPSGLPDDPRDPFVPVNYDERYHGPMTVRSALANSYNIPAVKTLQFVGVYDDPNTPEEDGLVNFAHRMGITDLNEDFYGLSLTLGGGEVKLLDLTGAFAVFANGGRRVPPVAITYIEDFEGNVIFDYETPAGEQVIRPEHAYLMTSILSDNTARTPAFGPNSALNLPFSVAAKTGTTNDFRDNWTLGFTPDVAVGVWVGNPDFTPMQNTSGLSGAAPIWNEFMQVAVQGLTNGNPTPFSRPSGIVERVICAVSGTEPSQWCPSERTEIFAADQLPLPSGEDLWRRTQLDTWTGLEASPECSEYAVQRFTMNVDDPFGRDWLKNTSQGRNWAESQGFQGFEPDFLFAPERECRDSDPRPTLEFIFPTEGEVISSGPLPVILQANATRNFDNFRLEYSLADEPTNWTEIYSSNSPVNAPQEVFSWDLDGLPANTMLTLRVYMESTQADRFAEKTVKFQLELPTPTPTPTDFPTATPTPTNTTAPSATSLPPSATFTPTPSLTPTATPTPTNTP